MADMDDGSMGSRWVGNRKVHLRSCHSRARFSCLLCAKSGHPARQAELRPRRKSRGNIGRDHLDDLFG